MSGCSPSTVRLLGGNCVARRDLIRATRIMLPGLHSGQEHAPLQSVLQNTRRFLCVKNAALLPVHHASTFTAELPSSSLHLPSPPPLSSSTSKSAHTRTPPSPISVLRQFLSQDFQPTDSPHTHTPNTLRSLYLSARSQKNLLTPDQLSNLISLFGSLSTNTPHALRSLLRNLDLRPSRTYWSFISKLIRDKKSLGHELCSVDRYWIMRYHLSRLAEEGNCGVVTANQDLSEARTQYTYLRCDSQPPNIHVCYAEALLAYGSPEHLPELIAVVCNMLTTQSRLDRYQASLLWRVMLSPGSPSFQSQVMIMNALHNRFETVELEVDGLVAEDPVPGAEPTVLDLVSLLEYTIFPLTPNPLSSTSLLPWAAREARAALFPTSDSQSVSAFAWRNACFLALVHSPSGHVHLPDTDDMATAVDWRILCVLATLEKTFERLDGVELPRGILAGATNVLEPIWKLWTQNRKASHHRPILVDRAIAAAILSLAGVLRDRSLLLNCRQYCLSHGFWFYQSSPLLTVEFAVASIACGERNWTRIFPGLDEHPSKNHIVKETISRCIMRYPESVHELHISSVLHSVELSLSTTVALARTVAQVNPEYGVAYLTDPLFPPKKLRRILETLLLSSVGFPGIESSPERLLIIGDAMLRVYANSSPPPHLRSRIEAILLAMMRASATTALKGIQMVHTIHRNSAGSLRTKFMTSALQCLISRRFFRVAFRFCRFQVSARVGQTRRWQRVLIWGLARGKAHTLARRASRFHPSPRPHPTSFETLVWIASFNVHHPSRVAALKILRKVQNDGGIGVHELTYAINLLVRGRRILAARTLYARTRYRIEDNSRTFMGNAILNASLTIPRRRNARRMQKLLRTLQELMKDYGFVPDRVTVNILLKGIFMWDKAIDSQRLRGLFDHLILSGYPGGVRDGEGLVVKPFSTKTSSVPFVVPLVEMSSEISFERHVRPLYKMFIKAFHLRGDREAARVVVGILKRVAEGAERIER